MDDIKKIVAERGVDLARTVTSIEESKAVPGAEYKCKNCDDSGFVFIDNGGCIVRHAAVRQHKAVLRTRRCECRRNILTAARLRAAEIPEKYKDYSFDNFLPYGARMEQLQNGKRRAMEFAEKYPDTSASGLLLVGPIGTGKTHLAIAALKVIIERGVRGHFFEYRELLKRIQETYDREAQCSELSLLQDVFDVPVLVIDELGASKPSEWVWDTVSLIINKRYSQRRCTIMTTNYRNEPGASYSGGRQRNTGETLGDRITEQMRSRLVETCSVIDLDGPDFRVRVRKIDN